MTYILCFTDEAKKDLAGIKKNEPAVFIKAKVLLAELQQHPRTGTGTLFRFYSMFIGFYKKVLNFVRIKLKR